MDYLGNINEIYNESFFSKYPEDFKDFDENSYIFAVVDGDNILNYAVFKKEEFFKDTEPIANTKDVPLKDLTSLISSLEYGVDILVPYNDGEDFYFIDETRMLKMLFSILGLNDLSVIFNKRYGEIFPVFKKIGVVDYFQRGYKNYEPISLRLMLFSYKNLVCSIQYSLRRYHDYLLLIGNDMTDYDYTNRPENELFDESITPMIIIQDDIIVRVNKAYYNIFGHENEAEVGAVYNYSSKDSFDMDVDERKEIMRKIMNREIFYHEDERTFLNVNNERVYVNSIIFPVSYNGRNAAQISLVDITDAKKSNQEALLLQEALTTVQNVSKIAYFNYKRPTGVLWSEQICDIIGSDMETMGNDMYELIDDLSLEDQDALYDKIAWAFFKGVPFDLSTHVTTPEGNIKYIVIYGEVSKDEDYDYVLGYVQDITSSVLYEKELKNTNEQLSKLLDEKEVLLKEVHHRVKNNLQVILSLLKLDVRFQPDDPEAILKSTQDRIYSMALIHEKIYKSSDLANINIKEYLEDIVNYLLNLYSIGNIDVNYNLEDIELSMDTSIPLGLIVNEMMHNVIKYAFPDGNGGNVEMNIHSINDNVIFSFADDGVGLPDNLDIYNSPSLGLTVINSLVNQLEGVFSKIDQPGTAYMISFKKG